jgi:hypothetical protein
MLYQLHHAIADVVPKTEWIGLPLIVQLGYLFGHGIVQIDISPSDDSSIGFPLDDSPDGFPVVECLHKTSLPILAIPLYKDVSEVSKQKIAKK